MQLYKGSDCTSVHSAACDAETICMVTFTAAASNTTCNTIFQEILSGGAKFYNNLNFGCFVSVGH
jgi:hypothetical protein